MGIKYSSIQKIKIEKFTFFSSFFFLIYAYTVLYIFLLLLLLLKIVQRRITVTFRISQGFRNT